MPVDNIQEEFGGEPVAAFSMSHPAVPALYMVLTLGLTMFSMQPVSYTHLTLPTNSRV